jgi:hypothetical protein
MPLTRGVPGVALNAVDRAAEDDLRNRAPQRRVTITMTLILERALYRLAAPNQVVSASVNPSAESSPTHAT